MLVLDSASIEKALEYEELIDHFARCHQYEMPELSDLLLETQGSNGGKNAFLNRAAWDAGNWLGIKCITVFPENQRLPEPLPSVQAVFLLFDGSNGTSVAVLDGASITRWKTACDSALGSRLLSRTDSRALLMVGAGNMAEPLIRAHLAARPAIDSVRIWNRSADKANALANRLDADGIHCTAASSLETAVAESDIVVTATMSAMPVIQGEWLRPGTHLDLVGAFTPDMREADDEAMRRGELYVDCRKTTIDEIGELILPIRNGTLSRDDVRADLFELSAGTHPGRSSDAAITVYKNGGGGHLDLMTATHIYQKFTSQDATAPSAAGSGSRAAPPGQR